MIRRLLAGMMLAAASAQLLPADARGGSTPIFITNQGFETVAQPSAPGIVGTNFLGGFWTIGIGSGGPAVLAGCCGAAVDFNNGDVWTGNGPGTWTDQNNVSHLTVDTPGWTQPNQQFGVEVVAEQGALGAYLNDSGNGSPLSTYSNQLGVGQAGVQIVGGQNYTLSIDAGGINGGHPVGPLVLDLIANTTNSATGATAAGATVLAGTGLGGFVNGVTTPTASWATYSEIFTAAQLAPFVGQYLYIGFGSVNTPGGSQSNFDNVTLIQSPEPGSLLLAALGAATVVGIGCRRRQSVRSAKV